MLDIVSISLSFPVLLGEPQHYDKLATDSDAVMRFSLLDTRGTWFVIADVADGFFHLTDSY